MWIDKVTQPVRGSHPVAPGYSSPEGKSGQDLINAEWPVSIGLAYALSFKMDKTSDKVQKLLSKWGKLDEAGRMCVCMCALVSVCTLTS